LARTRHDLDEPARLGKPIGEDGGLGRWKSVFFLLTTLSIFTQYFE
jgi:hypothetical protein